MSTQNTAPISDQQSGAVIPPGPAVLSTYVTAGEAIAPYDLVVIRDDGLAYYGLPPGQPEAMFRPLNQPEVSVVHNDLNTSVTLALNATNTNAGSGQDSVALSNGDVAVAYTAGNFVTVSIISADGSVVGSQQLGGVGVNTNLAVALLANDNVAVFFSSGNPAVLNVAVVSKTAQIVSSTVTIDNTTGGGAISAATLVGGNVVVGYTDGPNCNPKVQIVTPLGATVIAGFVVDTSSAAVTSPKSIAVTALANGGFAVAYAKTDGTTGSAFAAIFNGVGQSQGNVFQVGALYTANPSGPIVDIKGMSGGGFGVTGYGGNGPGFALNIYNSTGQIQTGNILLDSFDGALTPNRTSMAALTNGDLAVVWRNSTNVIGANYTATGTLATPNVVFGSFAGAVKMEATATGTVIAFQGTTDMAVVSTDYTLNGVVTTTAVPRGNLNSVPFIQATPTTLGDGATALIAGTAQNNIVYGLYDSFTLPQSTLIGITPTGAGLGQNMLVQITGWVPLRLSFAQTYSQDATNANPPGQKMSAIGSYALLKGIQP